MNSNELIITFGLCQLVIMVEIKRRMKKVKKKIVIPLIAGGMFFSSLQVFPALASDESAETVLDTQEIQLTAATNEKRNEELIQSLRPGNRKLTNNMYGISLEEMKLEDVQKEVLLKKAKELGISTEGKDMKTIQQEIRAAMIVEEAKKAGISTEGKDIATLKKELKEKSKKIDNSHLRAPREERTLQNSTLQNLMKKYNLSFEGGSLEEFQKELLTKMAEEIGISTDGLDEKEIMRKIREAGKQ